MTLNINTKRELAELANTLQVRMDWHEPDEQGVNARVSGTHLDNAMGPDPYRNVGELTVILYQRDSDGWEHEVGYVNLANVLAWASEAHR